MDRDEIIQLARKAILSEDTDAFEAFVFTIADQFLSDEDKNLPPWTDRPEE